MNEEKTRLQKIKEQLSEKMTRAIVEAIENGAKCEKSITGGGVRIDGVFLTPKLSSEYHSVILDVNAPEIEQLFEPSKGELERRAQRLRDELEEIENKLKPNEQ